MSPNDKSETKSDLCPTCHRRLNASPRICGKCKKVIGHHHKYYFSGSTVYHKDCKDPKAYPLVKP